MKSNLRPDERCDLIERVCMAAHDSTESWETDNIGMHLAYLLWVIAAPHATAYDAVDWTTNDTAGILRLFSEALEASDPVWAFIKRPPDRHYIVAGHIPHSFDPPMIACVIAPSPKLAVRRFVEGWLREGDTLPNNWWEEEHDPETDEPWVLIDGLFEINGAPIAIHADHEFYDI